MGVEGRTTGNHALTMRPNMLFVVIRIFFWPIPGQSVDLNLQKHAYYLLL